jgi:hypothetical protein
MNKRVGIVLIILVMLVAISTGCFEDNPPKPQSIELVETNGALNNTVGWLESTDTNGRDDDMIYMELESDIQLFLNDTNIYSISISLNFQDYDQAHSGTDENSPEDYVEVSVDGFDDVMGSGSTPCMINLNIKANKTEDVYDYISPELNIHVVGKCYCEITYPNTGRPSLINLYTQDQGVAYDISAEYKFHKMEG